MIEFKKGDKFQVITKYGPPFIQGEVQQVYNNRYEIKEIYGIPIDTPIVKSTNGVCYSLEQIKKIQ